MADKPLTGVVALVNFRTDSTFNFKQSISTKLTNLGAKVTKRFGREVTHIVFQKRLQPNTEQLIAERADLRALHDKASKAEAAVHIVSLLWVERSAADNKRAMEHKYAVPRPHDEDVLGHKGSGLTPGSSGRKRSRRTMQPKDLKELEVDTTDAIFSSSQLIREQSKAGVDVGEVSSPAPQHKKPKKAQQTVTKFVRYDGSQKPAASKAQLQHGQQRSDADGPPAAARPARGGNTITAALSRQQQQQGQTAVRNCQNRPTKQPAGTGAKRKRDDSQAATEPQHHSQEPASNSNSTAKAVQGKQQDVQKCVSKPNSKHAPADLPSRPGSADTTRSATRRQSSRLIHASASSECTASKVEADRDTQQIHHSIAEPVPHQEADLTSKCEDVDMADIAPTVAEATASDCHQHVKDSNAQQQGEDAETPLLQERLQLSGLQLGKPPVVSLLAAPVLIPGGSSRFSTRHLNQKLEVKLPVSKATPLGLPPTPLLPPVQQTSVIPIPEYTRVPSPWTTTPSDPSQPTPLPSAALLLAPATQPGLATASSVLPAPVSGAVPGPPVWSAVRPWDPKFIDRPAEPSEHVPKLTSATVNPEAFTSQPHAVQKADADNAEQPSVYAPQQIADGKAGAEGRQQHVRKQQALEDVNMREADGEEDEGSPSAGASTGCLSLSCVEGVVHEVARNAVRSLRGVRLCSEGREEGRLTHLVLGQTRRTLKVLLAIAAGAILVTPDWLTASLEAGEWLPEEPFLAKGRFADAAQAARGGPDHARPEPLLHGRKVYVHVAEAAKKGTSSGNGSALRRLVAALGGKAAGAKSCDLCIISGGGPRPTNLSARTLAVKEEWLLKGTEQYKLESTRLYAVR